MITKFKIFENYLNENNDTKIEDVRCNNCWWYGYYKDTKFLVDDDENEVCPNCGVAGMLMNASPIDLEKYPDFPDYAKNNKPKEGISKYEYNADLEGYYINAYPKYFTANKYNL